MKRIFFVEDDLSLINGLSFAIKKQGYETDIARTYLEAEKMWINGKYDLVILDVSLPDGSGYDLCKNIRQTSKVPIIFLTAADEETDIIMGLDIGGDDYITKPFTPMELMARVNSQLRRYHRFLDRLNSKQTENPKVHRLGGLEVNEETVEVTVDDKTVKVTPIEFKILLLLIQNPGRVFPAEEIYERVWNERAVNTDTVMVHIRNLREKIEVNPREPKYVKVVWGVGYKIEKQP